MIAACSDIRILRSRNDCTVLGSWFTVSRDGLHGTSGFVGRTKEEVVQCDHIPVPSRRMHCDRDDANSFNVQQLDMIM